MPDVKVGTKITCKCGCGEVFTKNSIQHVYSNGPKCRQRDIKNRIVAGTIKPIYFKLCEAENCDILVPVYQEISASAHRRTCSNKCGATLRFPGPDGNSTSKPFRQDYCRQGGECKHYDNCLDLGASKEWPRDRGEECFEKVFRPISDYDTRSAIQMTPRGGTLRLTSDDS